jgi:hypothetical protein
MRLLIVVCLTGLSTIAKASPWPAEASVAYVEELALACAKADPDLALRYEAKKDFLFSKDIHRVKQAQSGTNYPDMRKWARDTVRDASFKEIAKECRLFLIEADSAFEQAHPNKRADDAQVSRAVSQESKVNSHGKW